MEYVAAMNFNEFKSCIDKLESHFGVNSFTGFKRNKLWEAMRNEDASLLASSIEHMIDKLVKVPNLETALKIVNTRKAYLQKGAHLTTSNTSYVTRIEPFPDTPEQDTKFLMSFINARVQNRCFDSEWEFYMKEVLRPNFIAKGVKQRWKDMHGLAPSFAFPDEAMSEALEERNSRYGYCDKDEATGPVP